MLYCTVLSFGSIMTAYAYYRGMTEVLLGAIRGIGACFGVAATFVFPVLVRRIGVVRTGFVSIVTQVRRSIGLKFHDLVYLLLHIFMGFHLTPLSLDSSPCSASVWRPCLLASLHRGTVRIFPARPKRPASSLEMSSLACCFRAWLLPELACGVSICRFHNCCNNGEAHPPPPHPPAFRDDLLWNPRALSDASSPILWPSSVPCCSPGCLLVALPLSTVSKVL